MSLGQRLGRRLSPGSIICMFGDLGSGKTTFVRGVAKGLGVNPDEIHSPTFVLLNVYRGRLALYHYDFYRLEKSDEIAATGYDDFLYGEGVSFIEWSERFGPLIPKTYLRIEFVFIDETRRRITFSAGDDRYERMLKNLAPVNRGKSVAQKRK